MKRKVSWTTLKLGTLSISGATLTSLILMFTKNGGKMKRGILTVRKVRVTHMDAHCPQYLNCNKNIVVF
jgi:hypothetical protein